MPNVNLTDLTVRTLKPGLYFDKRTPAFGIRVGVNRKTWLVVKGDNRTKVRLGHYPDLSLADARKRALVALGTPLAIQNTIGFSEAVETFLAQPRWRPQSKRVLTSSLGHFTWKRALAKITHEDVATAIDAIPGSSARAHALKDIRTFFNWCVPRYLEVSPAAGLKMEAQPTRARVLSNAELKAVWKAAEQAVGPFGTIIKLLILTGQRKSEIGGLRWEWVRDDRITLPAAVAKNGREHTFPTSPLARSILTAYASDPPKKSGPVFLSPRNPDEPYNGYTFHLAELRSASETNGWTLHDLRRTFATNLAALGTPIHVTEKLLNHVSGSLSGVAGIYNRHSYWDEQQAAINAWEEKLLSIVR